MKTAFYILTILLLLPACGREQEDDTLNTELRERAFLDGAKGGHIEKVRELIVSGVNVNAIDALGRTALHHAAAGGNREMVELLLAHSADLDVVDKLGNTPLHDAADQERTEIVEFLVSKGADSFIECEEGETLLHAIADPPAGTGRASLGSDNNTLRLVGMLLGKGLDIDATDSRGMTPLHRAVQAGDRELSEFLIKQGASVNPTDSHGRTPLDIALERARSDIITLLHEHRGKTEISIPSNMVEAIKHRNIVKFSEFLQAAVKDKSIEKNCRGVLLCAMGMGDEEAVKLLVENGVGADGRVFHEAVARGNINIVELLIAGGADVNFKSWFRSRTPLHEAVRSDQIDMAALLIIKGAEINAQDSMGGTPLDCARTEEMKQLLRSYGAVSGAELRQGERER